MVNRVLTGVLATMLLLPAAATAQESYTIEQLQDRCDTASTPGVDNAPELCHAMLALFLFPDEGLEVPDLSGGATAAVGDIPGSGVFIVGSEVAPGTYRTTGPEPGRRSCYYARLSGFSGETDDIISNDNAAGQAVVEIQRSDAAFESNGCQPWTLVR